MIFVPSVGRKLNKTYMKIGTIWCWLFGHKFILKVKREEFIDGVWMIKTTWHRFDYCVRCGIDKNI